MEKCSRGGKKASFINQKPILKPMETIVSSFRSWLLQMGYRGGSVRLLPGCVASFLSNQRVLSVRDLEAGHITAFYEWLQHRPHLRTGAPLSNPFIGHHVYALRVFFGWLERTGQVSENVMSGLSFGSLRSNPRTALSPEAVSSLFAACVHPSETLLLHLFYSCGLRCAEAVALNRADVHLRTGLLYVRSGKNGRRRAVPLPARVVAAFRAYYALADTPGAVFVNRHGQRLSGDGYRRRFRQLQQAAGITPLVSLHHLRHSIATHLLAAGVSLEYVRDFLGHSHLEATQRYVQVSEAQLQTL